MRTRLATLLLAAVLVALPTGVVAQQRLPAAGTAALGGDVGFYVPGDEGLNAGPTFGGYGDFYFTSRVSLRVAVGWASTDFEAEPDESVSHIRVPINLMYNWEGGQWHPFITAGVGPYFIRHSENGHTVSDRTEVGGNLGGGLEYFATGTVAVKAEVLYHIVRRKDFEADPSGLSLTIGLKKYLRRR